MMQCALAEPLTRSASWAMLTTRSSGSRMTHRHVHYLSRDRLAKSQRRHRASRHLRPDAPKLLSEAAEQAKLLESRLMLLKLVDSVSQHRKVTHLLVLRKVHLPAWRVQECEPSGSPLLSSPLLSFPLVPLSLSLSRISLILLCFGLFPAECTITRGWTCAAAPCFVSALERSCQEEMKTHPATHDVSDSFFAQILRLQADCGHGHGATFKGCCRGEGERKSSIVQISTC